MRISHPVRRRAVRRKPPLLFAFAVPLAGIVGSLFGTSAPVQAQQPLSYSFIKLNSTGFGAPSASGVVSVGGVKYAVGDAYNPTTLDYQRLAWNLDTNTPTVLDSTGLIYATIEGGVTVESGGYAVGRGYGSVTGNRGRALAWNVGTNTLTFLDSTGLTTSSAWGAGKVGNAGYAVGTGQGTATGNLSRAIAWNLSTNTRTILDGTGLTDVAAYGIASAGGVGYAAGIGSGSATGGLTRPVAWNLSTNTRTLLDSSGLTYVTAFGVGDVGGVGYAFGGGYGTATGGDSRAMAWNLSTNTRTLLDSTGLRLTYVYGAGSAGGATYAFGNGRGATTEERVQGFIWNVATNTRYNLNSLFMPAEFSNANVGTMVETMSEDGSMTGFHNLESGSVAFVLDAFNAWEGDTLLSDRTARVTGSLTQTSGTTTIDGTYEFLGGVGNETYTLASGGRLQGTGTIIGNLTNAGGILSPGNSPGVFTIDGNYIQSTGGVLNIEISSLASFDALTITGNTTLGGTLNILFAPGFPNAFPASFDLLTTGGTISGFFDQVNIVGGLPSGATEYSLITQAGTTGSGMRLTLVVVPETGTLGLLGLALPLAGTLALARRRTA